LNKLYLLLTDESSEINALEKNQGAILELKIKRKFENQEKIEEEDDEDEDISSSENESEYPNQTESADVTIVTESNID